MIDLPSYSHDVLKRNVQKGLEREIPSPMDPPEAFAPSTVPPVVGEMPPVLKTLIEEHDRFLKVFSVFDNALIELKKNRWIFTSEISAGLKQFFQTMDKEIAQHTRKEEKALFPVLYEKFLATGEHSPGARPMTPVDVMEADHQKVEQLTVIVFNLLGLAPRMKSGEDRELLFEKAFEQGQEIVEIMKLHIYKENTVLFPLAQRLISGEEMSRIETKILRF